MSKLIILTGLQASGKTTWARERQAKDGNTIRVNYEELHTMLHGDAPWTRHREKMTRAAERLIVAKAIDPVETTQPRAVIVDDPNLDPLEISAWQELARSLSVASEVVNFGFRTLHDCIERDAKRPADKRVGRGVIERTALKYGKISLSAYDKVAIVDIDGTVANLDHRIPMLEKKDYEAFFANAFLDGEYCTIVDAVVNLSMEGYKIIFLSGRPDRRCGHATNEWFNTMGIPVDHLFMRRDDDHAPDDQVKRKLLERLFDHGLRKEAIKIVIDDRNSVCDVWRSLDLPLVQVLKGAAISIHPYAFELAMKVGIPISGA